MKYNTKSYTCMIVLESPTSPPSPTVSVSYPSSRSNSSKLIWITCDGKKATELVRELFVMERHSNQWSTLTSGIPPYALLLSTRSSFHAILIKLLGTTDIIRYKRYTLFSINMISVISPGQLLTAAYVACIFLHISMHQLSNKSSAQSNECWGWNKFPKVLSISDSHSEVNSAACSMLSNAHYINNVLFA